MIIDRPRVMVLSKDGTKKPWTRAAAARGHVVLEPDLRPKHFSEEQIIQAVQAAVREAEE